MSILISGAEAPPGAPAPPRTCLSLFEDRAAALPGATAVVAGGAEASYAEVNRRANRLARRLRAGGVGRESLVGLFVHRSVDAAVAILAVWKAGGAFVPIDPGYPAERVGAILADTRAGTVLTQRRLADRLPPMEHAFEVVCIDDDPDDVNDPAPADDLGLAADPADLAYVIFTSGSTGRPKGVMVEHAGLAEYLGWLTGEFSRGKPVSSLLHSSLSFDFSYSTVLLPLVTGGFLKMVDEQFTLEDLPLLIQDPALDLVRLTPSHIDIIATVLHGQRDLPGPGSFLVGGEVLRAHQVALLRQLFPGSAVYNHYGPTEAVIGRSALRLEDGDDFRLDGYPEHDPVPIGRPFHPQD